MDRKQLVSLLRNLAARAPEASPFCPADEEIAGYVDDTLSPEGGASVARHISECRACVRRVGLTVRLLREQESQAARSPLGRSLTPVPATIRWAAAAMVIVTVGWLALLPSQDPQFRQTRTLDLPVAEPRILAPTSGLLAMSDNFEVRWTEVPGTLYYEVRLLSDIGDVIHRERVESVEWAPGDRLDLTPGREYFIRIDAFLSESQSIQSDHFPVRIVK